MALGFGSKKTEDEKQSSPPDNGEKFGDQDYYNGFKPDTEAQAAGGPRRMSRLDRPMISSISGSIDGRASMDGTNEVDISIGKQVEMEAGNAIQYRTCSWQKV